MPAAIRALAPPRPLSLSELLPHLPSLVLSLLPGVGFAVGLALATATGGAPWLGVPTTWPWQLWAIALAGSIATSAGVLDWLYHRQAGVTIGRPERRAELLALGLGGAPLFVLMGAASLASDPESYLVPVMLALVATTAMVVFDEVAFHRRRCAPVETLLHRALTVGHLAAFLAWAHGVFVDDALALGRAGGAWAGGA